MKQIIGNFLLRLDIVDSTNNYAKWKIREEELPEGTVVLAYEQTSGRGQLTNVWESEPGLNLLFSIVLYPAFLAVRHQFLLSQVVTLGIRASLSKYVDGLKIKWPNDIYVGDMKLGGILIENSVMGSVLKDSVIGIGLNVNQTEFRSDAPNPISLKMLTNKHLDVGVVLSDVLSSIDKYYQLLREGNDAEIRNEFTNALYRVGEEHTYRAGNEVFKGEIVGVAETGQLLVRKTGGKIAKFHFKEIVFLFDTK